MCHKPCFLSTVRAPQRGWSPLLACKVNRLGGVRHDDMSLSLVFKSVLNSVTFHNCCRFWKCAKEKILYRSNSFPLLACKVNRLGGVRHDDMSLSLVFKSVLNSVTFHNCCRFWKCAKEKILYRSNSLRRKEANSSGPHHRMCLGKTGILLLQTAKRFP